MITSASKITHEDQDDWFLLNDILRVHYIEDNGALDVELDFDDSIISHTQAKELSQDFLRLLLKVSKEKS